MKPHDDRLVTNVEQAFLGALAVLVLLILPMLGAEAMLFGAGAGLVAYTFLFRERLRRRGWLMAVIPITLAALFGAAVAAALSRGN